MREIFTLFLHAMVTIIRLAQPGGLRAVVAESVLMRHQVLILNRGRKRAPNLRSSDRIIAGLCTLLMRPARVLRSAVVLKTSTLLHFHRMLIKQKYRLLFSPKRFGRPGPKGPTKELIDAVVRNETAQSHLGLQAHCSADRLGLRRRHRQRCGSPDSGNTLPSGSGLRRSVLAFLYRSR